MLKILIFNHVIIIWVVRNCTKNHLQVWVLMGGIYNCSVIRVILILGPAFSGLVGFNVGPLQPLQLPQSRVPAGTHVQQGLSILGGDNLKGYIRLLWESPR